jgi:hypothetical protein
VFIIFLDEVEIWKNTSNHENCEYYVDGFCNSKNSTSKSQRKTYVHPFTYEKEAIVPKTTNILFAGDELPSVGPE